MSNCSIMNFLILLISTTTSRTCRSCGGSSYYDVYRPSHRYIKTVCGTNGLTYKNICYARCNSAEIAHRGACNTDISTRDKNPCHCSNDNTPVMTMQGIFKNKCLANC